MTDLTARPATAPKPVMDGCICDTRWRWPFMHLSYCPWRRQAERTDR